MEPGDPVCKNRSCPMGRRLRRWSNAISGMAAPVSTRLGSLDGPTLYARYRRMPADCDLCGQPEGFLPDRSAVRVGRTEITGFRCLPAEPHIRLNVRLGSEAEVQQTRAGCLLLAKSGHRATSVRSPKSSKTGCPENRPLLRSNQLREATAPLSGG